MKRSQLKELIKHIIREAHLNEDEMPVTKDPDLKRGVEPVMGFVNVEEGEEDELDEQTGTGAVAGYATPFAFAKNKEGSSRGIKAAKKYGKVVKSISERT
jgi:hypothetical protein